MLAQYESLKQAEAEKKLLAAQQVEESSKQAPKQGEEAQGEQSPAEQAQPAPAQPPVEEEEKKEEPEKDKHEDEPAKADAAA